MSFQKLSYLYWPQFFLDSIELYIVNSYHNVVRQIRNILIYLEESARIPEMVKEQNLAFAAW